jgi:hypothetical protein
MLVTLIHLRCDHRHRHLQLDPGRGGLHMKPTTLALSAMLSAGCIAAPAQAATEVGTLACQGSPTVGLVVGSVQRFRCIFQPSRAGAAAQPYRARAAKVGLDLGITAGSRMVWSVVAPTNEIKPGALAGRYIGASGSIALGLGVGANALVGGFRNSIALQPISVEAQAGLRLALGAEGFRLEYGR